MFAKDEGYFKQDALKPRVVMEVADLTDIIPIAPFVNALADYWHYVDSTYLPPVIWLSGLNRSVVSEWYQRWASRFPRAVENDFSEFESRISVELLELEFSTYDSFGFRHLRPWFDIQKRMDIRGAGWRFRRRGGRMSGVPNTSLGNTIINLTTHLYVLRRYTPGKDFVMVVNGDDNLIWCTDEVFEFIRADMVASFLRLGMKAEVVLHEDPLKGNFCSSRFGFCNGQAVLAPHPFRAMAKAGKFPSDGAAGPSTVVALFRDYSSTPHFWPLHRFVRHWLDHMGYSYETSPSLSYDVVSAEQFTAFLAANHIRADGTWIIRDCSAVRAGLEDEGLVFPLGAPEKPRNFNPPVRFYGLPPRWGRPGWLRAAAAIRQKLLQFWRKSDYTRWEPRLEYCAGDALRNQPNGPQI